MGNGELYSMTTTFFFDEICSNEMLGSSDTDIDSVISYLEGSSLIGIKSYSDDSIDVNQFSY